MAPFGRARASSPSSATKGAKGDAAGMEGGGGGGGSPGGGVVKGSSGIDYDIIAERLETSLRTLQAGQPAALLGAISQDEVRQKGPWQHEEGRVCLLRWLAKCAFCGAKSCRAAKSGGSDAERTIYDQNGHIRRVDRNFTSSFRTSFSYIIG